MKNNLEELKELIAEVKLLFEQKKSSTNIQGSLNNISRKIQALENDYKEIKELFQSQPNVIINFRKRATEIKEEIVLLS